MNDTRDTVPTSQDTTRQVVVAVSLIIGMAGALLGSGLFGGESMPEAAGGAFSADATLIAPAGPAFSIWSAIYFGLGAYAVWQFLPAQKASPRHRRLGYPIAASLLLNAAWLFAVQQGFLPLTVLVIALLLAVLVYAFLVCLSFPEKSWVEAIAVDGVVGLYLGWVCVATAANVAAVLVAYGFAGWGLNPDIWAVVVVAVAGLVGLGLAIYGRGRLAPTFALCWGLAWVAVGRLAGEPESPATAVAAICAVLVVLVATAVMRLRVTHAGV